MALRWLWNVPYAKKGALRTGWSYRVEGKLCSISPSCIVFHLRVNLCVCVRFCVSHVSHFANLPSAKALCLWKVWQCHGRRERGQGLLAVSCCLPFPSPLFACQFSPLLSHRKFHSELFNYRSFSKPNAKWKKRKKVRQKEAKTEAKWQMANVAGRGGRAKVKEWTRQGRIW